MSDYCEQIARGLARAGEEVHVWAPPIPAPPSPPLQADGVMVHRLSSQFHPGALKELGEGLDRCPGPRRLFVQYVAGAFGYRAMNLAFCVWLHQRRSEPLWLMFHEYAYPMGWRLKPAHNLLGVVTPAMSRILASRAQRIFVSTPAWVKRLPASVASSRPIEWLPIPSNIPARVDEARVRTVRETLTGGRPGILIGHFGTYGRAITALLDEILPALLSRDAARRVVLMGRGSIEYASQLCARHPALTDRVTATGGLPPDDLAAHIRACDVIVQLYDDGATSRRGSLMACLALGMPVVTNLGRSSEGIWLETLAVESAGDALPFAITMAAERLLRAPERWSDLGRRAAELYASRFSLERSLATLREVAAREEAGAATAVAPAP